MHWLGHRGRYWMAVVRGEGQALPLMPAPALFAVTGSHCALLALVLAAGFAFATPGHADQPRLASVDLRVKFTQSERRDQIMALLVSRGVESPLLQPDEDVVALDLPRKAKVTLSSGWQTGVDPQLDRLLSLIGAAEAGSAEYDAIHHRATVLPAKPPTALTMQEIVDWIAATPRQNHAIGRYQIIPMTLNYLINAEKIPMAALFTPDLQDRLALRLIEDAGLNEFRAGVMSPEDFLDSLAFVWAGLPLGSGRSAYEGIAGNKATISRRQYESEFVAIFGLGAVQIALSPDVIPGNTDRSGPTRIRRK